MMGRQHDVVSCRAAHAVPARPRVARRAVLLGAAAAIFAGFLGGHGSMTWAADEPDAIERRVKGAYLYKFAGYVAWPAAAFARADTPITIAVMGAEALAAELEQAVVGRTVGDRTLAVKRLKPGDALTGVHVLFISKTEAARLPQIAPAAQARAILLVSETEGALRQGSVINFIVAEQRIRFEISLDAAEKSGFKLSSQLLAVAQQVVSGGP
jgi:hypothetical protein